jgi:hypothetical protein
MLNRTQPAPRSSQVHHIPPAAHKKRSSDDHVSTIEKSKSVASPFTTSKPILPHWDMIEQVNRLEKATDVYTQLKQNQIDQSFKRIQDLQREEALKLAEADAASQNVSFWGILEDIGSTIMSAVSFFFGFAALTTGGAAIGGALIVSGILSFSSIAFKHAKGWDWIADQVAGDDKQLRQAIVTYLPVAVGITAAAMGAYGAWGAWHYAPMEGSRKALAILETAAGLAKGISAFGSGKAAAFYKTATAEFSALQTKTELTTLGVEEIIVEIKDLHKQRNADYELAAKLIQDASHAIQLTQQPV